ncbi:hypothetical protein HY625_00350 [Candidatus Uhrbacteria bacterium]|nr:hypothetical protein [Candidatus Uhrbacteria bacterium]
MGDLIRTPHSEVTATLEVFDRLGVTPRDFEALRKGSSWNQEVVARVLRGDALLLAMLATENFGKKAGFTEADFNKLASDEELMRKFFFVVRGIARVERILHLIDLDAEPYIPDGWKKEEHTKGVQFEWNPKKVQIYLSKKQKGEKYIKGNRLRRELAKKPVFNANLLDYLLAHPEIIPDEWKGRAVFFWGTIYRLADDGLVVRCLCWNGGQWDSFYRYISDVWREACPALCAPACR